MDTQTITNGYITIPKTIIQDPLYATLSPQAVLLYGCMLDRNRLSTKNQWHDEHGDVYFYYTNENVQQTLRCKENKATSVVKELERRGLIVRKSQGMGQPQRIYIREISGLDPSFYKGLDPYKTRTSNPEKNKNDFNKPDRPDLSLPSEEMRRYVQQLHSQKT